MIRLLLLLSAAALTLPAAAAAQRRDESPPAMLDSVQLYELADRLQQDDRIRVRTRDDRLEVRDLTLTPGALLYRRGPDDSGPGAIPWSQVAQIQVRKSAVLQGGMAGAAILGMTGLAGGLAVGCPEGSYVCFQGSDVALLTAGGAVAGFFIGALVAAPFGKWTTVYRSEKVEPRPGLTIVPQTGAGSLAVGLRFDL